MNEEIWVIVVSVGVLSLFLLLSFVFWLWWRVAQRVKGVSPYTGTPLRRLTAVSYYSTERIAKFLSSFQQYDNRLFKFSRAAFCRETGRIFQDCVTWYDTIEVDWNFMTHRCAGHYVSWGSLSSELQREIRERHDTLEAFQTAYSSPTPAPRAIEPQYIYAKPGPLYVDPVTYILVGWQCVPDTEFEVLIVQHPRPHST